jgi:hypothetical protein
MDNQPTPDKVLNQILSSFVNGMQAVLNENFLGAYLGGSFAHGGWDAYSDVDFDVVIERDLYPAELEALKVLHARVYIIDSYWAKHFEGAYFPKEILGSLVRTNEPVWYLDNGSLNFERSTHDNTLVVRWVLREHGITLAGPPPQTWIPHVPEDMLKAEVRVTMQDWGEEILGDDYQLNNRWAQAFAVLSYCRMLQTLATGKVKHKPAGAAWAKENLAPTWHGLIDDALSARPNQYQKYYQPSDPVKVKRTKSFIQYALDWGKMHQER